MKRSEQVFGQQIWQWALVLVAFAAFFMSLIHVYAIFNPDKLKISDNASDGVFKYLITCVATLAILRAGSLLKAKFFGVEFEFGAIVEQSNQLKLEVQELRNSMAEWDYSAESIDFVVASNSTGALSVPENAMPELAPIKTRGDQQKGRFGGQSHVGDYFLGASFDYRNLDDTVVKVTLKVARTDSRALSQSVTFFLHETFRPRDEIVVTPAGTDVTLDLLVFGGFTVGAWVHGTPILLELDLAQISGAPTAIRER